MKWTSALRYKATKGILSSFKKLTSKALSLNKNIKF